MRRFINVQKIIVRKEGIVIATRLSNDRDVVNLRE